MKKLIITLLACCTLMSCTHIIKPYRPPIQQGNVITNDMVKQLRPGMTKQQVSDIFGEPVLTDPFDNNTWSYVYTFQPSRGKTQKKQLIVYFNNDRVSNYTVDLPPPSPTRKKHRFL